MEYNQTLFNVMIEVEIEKISRISRKSQHIIETENKIVIEDVSDNVINKATSLKKMSKV